MSLTPNPPIAKEAGENSVADGNASISNSPAPDRAYGRKRRVLIVLLVAFALWPVAHGYWVSQFLVNPWRMFGWAMYCVPTYQPQVRFFGTDQNRSGEITFPQGSASARLQRQLYVRQRSQLGDLASPALLAAEVLRAYPHLDTLTIAVSHPVYSPADAAFKPQLRRYDFTRRETPGADPADTAVEPAVAP